MFSWLKQLLGRSKVSRNLKLLTCSIHGSHYYDCLELVEAEQIYRGDRLILRREPQNEYDDNAIEVFTQDEQKLGYVPKNNNTVIAALMDQGCDCYALVERVEPEAWDPVSIRIEWQQLS